jgi:hypothetical protein
VGAEHGARLTIHSSRSRFAARLNSGVMPQDPADLLSLLEDRRKYASFFEIGEKWQKELSVGEELVRALNDQNGLLAL